MQDNLTAVIDAAKNYFRDHKEECSARIQIDGFEYSIFLHDQDRILTIRKKGSDELHPIQLTINDGVGCWGDPGFSLG